MYIKTKITSLIKKIRKLPVWITIPATVVLIVFLAYIVVFFQEKTVNFSYSEKSTCVQHLTFLPNLNKPTTNSPDFMLENKDILKLGSVQIFSRKTCFNAKKALSEGNVRISEALFGGWFAKKTFKLVIPQLPLLKLEPLSQPIPTGQPLVINLSTVDVVYKYQLEVGDKSVQCPLKGSDIYCDILSLHLLQGTTYSVKLVRMFNSQRVSTIFSKDIKTLDATKVVSASITQGQFVYDKPKTFLFQFNKEVIKGSVILEKIEGEKRTSVISTTSINAKQANLIIQNDLARDALYEFTIDQIVAKDGSTLESPYKLSFNVSDGPSVIGIDADATGQPLSQTITLTFDQGILASQDISSFVTVSGISATISKSGNKVFISYSDAPVCKVISIHVNPGLASNNGVTQNDPWDFSTHTVCYTTLTIGNSVNGRPILAYVFGSGGTTILFTGGIHGSERSGSYIMHDWISYLDNNANKIPADKKIVIVPDVNPDGLATNSRYNANNVNIDRNFPSTNWTADIDNSSGLTVGGGGVSALSEPETRALANLTASLQPRLEVSFHAKGNLVGANQSGDSVSIANQYASSVGYRSMIGLAEETMGYTITGEYEDWAGEQYGIPAILIELPTSTGRHFWAHQSILWKMVNI